MKGEISGELTIYTAASEKQRLLEMMNAQPAELELNLADVSEIDTAGLQVLIVLKQEAKRQNKKLHYVMHSKAVLDVLELSNLSAYFGDPIIM